MLRWTSVALVLVSVTTAVAGARAWVRDQATREVTKEFATRVEDAAGAQCFAALSRPLLDPDDANRAVRVLTLYAVIRVDEPARVLTFKGVPIVAVDSREPLTTSWMGALDSGDAPVQERERYRFWIVAAPAGGKTWGEVATADDLDIQVKGRVRK
jgi:hypothetical protein